MPLRVRRIATYVLVVGVAPLWRGCILPTSFKQVRQPREGAVLNHRVCVVYSQRYQIDLGGFEKLHAFDINKYAKIYLQLVTDGLIRPEDVFVPEPVTRDELLLVHSADYLERLRDPEHLARYLESGFVTFLPAGISDAAILARFRCATGGTILAARLALRHGIGINLGGGYHHAEPDRGGGFCIYADMPIAIRVLQREGLIRRALVVDLDVHQGNGTARCVAADDNVFTFDMHEEDIYPQPKQQNDLDVPLDAGTGDEEYLRILSRHLAGVFDAARPDIVFYQSGVDSLAGDPLANLRLSKAGLLERDRRVFHEAVARHVPIVMVLGGGYSDRAWEVQYAGIRERIIEYGLEGSTLRANPRQSTAKERMYSK